MIGAAVILNEALSARRSVRRWRWCGSDRCGARFSRRRNDARAVGAFLVLWGALGALLVLWVRCACCSMWSARVA